MILATSSVAAWANKRVALIVGNSAYQSVSKLPNPSKDANAVAKMFKEAGFEVIVQHDVGNLDFKRAIRRFGDASLDAEIAVVYYAGHGIEVNGASYLIPVDAKLASDRDAADEAVPLDRLLQEVEDVGGKNMRLRLIILDACRDNPFAKTMRVARQGSRSRSTGVGGIGAVQPTAGSDMLVAYAAKAGQTADDGDGDHSPFTQALLRSLTIPGLDIRLAFGRVRDDVLKTTNSKQEPFVYGSLGGGVVSLVAAAPQVATVDPAAAKADYDLVAQIGTKKAFEIFLSTYKTGFYAELAKAQLEELNKLDQQPRQAALPTQQAPAVRANTEEQRAWSKVEGSTDIGQLQAFIKQYPNAPQAILAQNRVEVLQKGVREREEKLAAEKRAADIRKAEADKQRLEREAAAAAAKREDDERRVREAKNESERKAAEAAAKRAEEERRAKLAELERAQAEERRKKREEEERLAFLENERKKSNQTMATPTATNVTSLAAVETRPGPSPQPRPADPVRVITNTPVQVTAAQKHLARIGCYAGKPDGNYNEATKGAVNRYMLSKRRLPKDAAAISDEFVSELEQQKGRVCPLVCQDGYEVSGDACVAKAKPVEKPKATARSRDDDRRREAARPQQQPRQQASAPAPRPSGGHGGGSVGGVGF
jgi:uncharacterized caspase-like protein